MFTAVLTFGYLLLFSVSELALPIVITVVALATYIFVLRLNQQQRYELAKVVLLVNGNFQIASIAFLLGRDAGVHFFLYPAALSPFLYYSIKKISVPAFFSGLSALLYLALELSFYLYESLIVLSPIIVKAIYMMTYLSAMLAVVMFAVYMYLENQRNENKLEAERERSETLLLNILPQEIATRLKNGEAPIADNYDDVSILFADLVGFTPLSAGLTAKQLFELLSEVFGHFDSVVEKHGVEKLRTVGDGYLVVSGLPLPCADHAQLIASAALEMLEFKSSLSSELVQGLELRIGINSGPVIAGVIGQKKFQFDLWGDTVNTASRMESHGLPGKVQISKATYELIKDDFKCEHRGAIEVKGKDSMETWFLMP